MARGRDRSVSDRSASSIGIDEIEALGIRVRAHLVGLERGHDPLGHLFAIERLARAARAELLQSRRDGEPERHPR